jgi:hypothetical protein
MTDAQKKAISKTKTAAVGIGGCIFGVLADRLFSFLF